MVRVLLPYHLRNLAGVDREVQLELENPVSVKSVLDVLEQNYPVLRGTIREHVTERRRAFLRFFAGGEDISLNDPAIPLPKTIGEGLEPLMVVGAIAGG